MALLSTNDCRKTEMKAIQSVRGIKEGSHLKGKLNCFNYWECGCAQEVGWLLENGFPNTVNVRK